MNLSSNKKKIVKTADGIPFKEGMTVYVPYVSIHCKNVEEARIEYFKVKHWHNGRNARLFLPYGKFKHDKRFVDVSGYGGAGVYNFPFYNHDNYDPYDFFRAKRCYADLNKAKEYIRRKALELSKEYRKISETAFDIVPHNFFEN